MGTRLWSLIVMGALLTASGCDEGENDGREVGDRGFDDPELAFPEYEAEPGHGMYFVGEVLQELDYEFQDDYAVHQGDIILGHIDELDIYQLGHEMDEDTARAAVRPDRLWPDGVVPYAFDSVSSDTRDKIDYAIDYLEDRTSIRFIERKGETAYIRIEEPDKGCSSSIGRVGGGSQALRLALGCSRGSAIHEFMHALGVWHEQSRADRDDHVTIHWEAIRDNKDGNFETYEDKGLAGEDVGAYDDQSIMHYGSYYFDKGDGPTITRKDGTEITAQRTRMTDGDIKGIDSLYGRQVDYNSCYVTLAPGDVLARGESRTSCNGKTRLVMQEDGNLVVYDSSGNALWHTHTYGTDASFAAMQSDGNLVLRAASFEAVWSSGTAKHPDAFLWVSNSGEVKIMNPGQRRLWTGKS